jgi:hypothetical protein
VIEGVVQTFLRQGIYLEDVFSRLPPQRVFIDRIVRVMGHQGGRPLKRLFSTFFGPNRSDVLRILNRHVVPPHVKLTAVASSTFFFAFGDAATARLFYDAQEGLFMSWEQTRLDVLEDLRVAIYERALPFSPEPAEYWEHMYRTLVRNVRALIAECENWDRGVIH